MESVQFMLLAHLYITIYKNDFWVILLLLVLFERAINNGNSMPQNQHNLIGPNQELSY